MRDIPATLSTHRSPWFSDGAEAMLRRSEFSILEEFKGEDLAGAADESGFNEWKEHIIFRCIVGSQAFGSSTDDSDIDRPGIYLPPAECHWSLYGVPAIALVGGAGMLLGLRPRP